jgi:phospholipase/carboxylesterase
MNRPAFPTGSVIHHTKSLTPDEISDVLDFDIATYEGGRLIGEAAAPCATFAPVHYEPGYAYPLLVWLHGPGGNEHQLPHVMPLVSDRNFVGVAPRGTHAVGDRQGQFDWRQTSEEIAEAESRVFASVAVAARRFNIHSGRVFLAGYGSGGTMALRIAWNNPRHFGGVAAIGGPIPAELRPFGRINELRTLPCLLASARQSRAYPEDLICRDLRLLHAAGCEVDLWYYVHGDELGAHTFTKLNRWLMALVCGSRC